MFALLYTLYRVILTKFYFHKMTFIKKSFFTLNQPLNYSLLLNPPSVRANGANIKQTKFFICTDTFNVKLKTPVVLLSDPCKSLYSLKTNWQSFIMFILSYPISFSKGIAKPFLSTSFFLKLVNHPDLPPPP